MEWLGNNWFWILIIGGMVAMHLFGHRGHGSGHKHGAKPPESDSDAAHGKVPPVSHSHAASAETAATDPEADPPTEPPTGHKHGS